MPSILRSTLIAALIGTVTAGSAVAQSWPARPIRLLVPLAAGSTADIISRAVGTELSRTLGQPVVVENKPGAGGVIGADAVAKSAPDGYSVVLATGSTHSVGPALNPKLPYQADKDFLPIVHVATAPSVMVTGASFPVNNIKEMVDLLKRSPGKYNFGSSGIGTYPHLTAEMFKWRAGGLFVVHIPYRGTGLVITDLVAGQIAFLMDSVVSAQTHIRDGKVKPLAVTGTRRSESLPQVPTFAEVGIEGMNISNWFGMLGPAAMPAEIAARMNREVNAALKAPEVIERLTRAGAEPVGGTPDAFKSIIRTEYDNWKALIARAGIKPESGS